jgi:hypothetical protein
VTSTRFAPNGTARLGDAPEIEEVVNSLSKQAGFDVGLGPVRPETLAQSIMLSEPQPVPFWKAIDRLRGVANIIKLTVEDLDELFPTEVVDGLLPGAQSGMVGRGSAPRLGNDRSQWPIEIITSKGQYANYQISIGDPAL